MAEDFDVVVVGGGALATVLSRAGLAVLVLEKSAVFRDLVRGEWMAPWGVLELIRLGLYDAVRAAGGHHVARHWACDEDVPPHEALAMTVDLTTLVPGVRFSASVAATMENEFGDAARARRRRARERQMQDPTLMLPLFAAFLGPDNVPAETFEESTRQRLFAPH